MLCFLFPLNKEFSSLMMWEEITGWKGRTRQVEFTEEVPRSKWDARTGPWTRGRPAQPVPLPEFKCLNPRDQLWEIKAKSLFNLYIKRKCFYNNYCSLLKSDRSNLNRNLGGNGQNTESCWGVKSHNWDRMVRKHLGLVTWLAKAAG